MNYARRTYGGLIALLFAAAGGCGGTTSNTDAGADTALADSADVTALDSAAEAASDAVAEPAADAGPEAAMDAGPEAGPEAGADAATDAQPEAAADAPADTARTDASGRVPVNHRPDDTACQSAPPAGNCSFGGPGACSRDSDCVAGSNGRCNQSGHGAAICSCSYDQCTHDTECPTSQLCACHGAPFASGAGNACTPGNCRTDSNCGAGGYCSPSRAQAGCGQLGGYYCHTSSDGCVDDSDCTSGSGPQACTYVTGSARWECVTLLLCP